ncbi:MAG: DNA repair exonuclease [Candidatus Aerophobetes bacterium]|nr:DNA repair exonuclease [Candidatus Aerophobetes bacterium]
MKILHTADIHLREYEDERWKALKRLIEIGKKEKVEIFVISGDLFNEDIDAENLRGKIREIFSNNGFKIVLIPGNHDSDSYRSGMYFGEDTIILTDVKDCFEYKDVRICGLPFEPIEGEEILGRLHFLANKFTLDKKNILLYHGELDDAFFSRKDFGDEGEERYMPVKLSYFKDLHIDYILGGHFHSKFDVRRIKNGGYFVYPGSPISITKRETGQRKVNIFEVGRPPGEYPLDMPYFEEVSLKFDPFEDKNPLKTVEKCVESFKPQARIILTIKGYINGKEIKISESELIKQIKKITLHRCAESPKFEFKDIQAVLEDDLFKKFLNKLEQTGHSEEKKRQICDTAIKAMIEAKL